MYFCASEGEKICQSVLLFLYSVLYLFVRLFLSLLTGWSVLSLFTSLSLDVNVFANLSLCLCIYSSGYI